MPGPDGKLPFKNLFDCMSKEIANNGFRGLYVGLPIYSTRIIPHAMLILIISQKLRESWTKIYL